MRSWTTKTLGTGPGLSSARSKCPCLTEPQVQWCGAPGLFVSTDSVLNYDVGPGYLQTPFVRALGVSNPSLPHLHSDTKAQLTKAELLQGAPVCQSIQPSFHPASVEVLQGCGTLMNKICKYLAEGNWYPMCQTVTMGAAGWDRHGRLGSL